jgi:hypothetical protein
MTGATRAIRWIPLWVVASVVFAEVRRSRAISGRPGNLSVRVRTASGEGWSRGNAAWIDNALAVCTGITGWGESVNAVTAAAIRSPRWEEWEQLRQLEQPVIATFASAGGETIEVAARGRDEVLLLGPFAPTPTVPGVTELDRAEAVVPAIPNLDRTVAVTPWTPADVQATG